MQPQHAPIRFSESEIRQYFRTRVPGLREVDQAGWWRGPCPLHGGKGHNFAVEAATGAWRCHSQCQKGGSGPIDYEIALTGAAFIAAKRAVYEILGSAPPAPANVHPIRKRRPDWMQPVKHYPYLGLDRKLRYQVIRYEGINPESGEREKDFGQRMPDDAGKWIYKEPAYPDKILYRWPDWHAWQNVIVVEGEKNANDVWQLGLPGTTALGGSGRPWQPQYTEALKGKRVAIIPDADEVGLKFATRNAAALHAAGVQVKLLPVCPDGHHDVSDWIAAGATQETITAFIKAAPWYEPPSAPTPEPAAPPPDPAEVTRAAIQAAIGARDLAAIYGHIPGLAAIPHADLMAIVAKLQQEFGRGFSKRDLLASIKAHRAAERAAASATDRGAGILPHIIVNDRAIRDLTADALRAMRATNAPPSLFVRARAICEIDRDADGRPVIAELGEHELRGRIDRAANFIRCTDKGDNHVAVPMECVRDVLTRPLAELGLPRLAGIIEVPALRPDGTIIDQPGYDPVSGLVLALPDGLEMAPIPAAPTPADLDQAIDLITEAICDFPFVDLASQANLIGLMLTVVLRQAIPGPCPLALIDAPNFGTGKSLLADVVNLITTGDNAPMAQAAKSDEEMSKHITAVLRAGRPIVCFDNVAASMDYPSLASALTAEFVEDRLLGSSEMIQVPNKSVWIATGNNIHPGAELARRCYACRIDAGTSTPYRGRQFRHPNLRRWIREHRPALLRSLLVMARSWYAAGAVEHVADPLGSFEEWHQIVGSVLKHCGFSAFLANAAELEAIDEDAIQWEAWLRAVAVVYPGRAFSVPEVCESVRHNDTLRQALPDFLAEALAKQPEALRRKMGYAFRNRNGRRVGPGCYVERAGITTTGEKNWVEWTVVVK